MEVYKATEIFSSLAQETRLTVFRLLLEYGADGAMPGGLAEELRIPPNTLSFHLAHMTMARLVRSTRAGRSITYFAETALVPQLITFLQANCCVRESDSKPKAKRKACV